MIFVKLRQLRFLLRVFTAIDGTASALFAIASLLVLDLCGDRFFEFSQFFRILLLPTLAVLIGMIVWKRLLSRLFCPIQDWQLAQLFEKREPRLNESLITSVELQREGQETGTSYFLRETAQRAASLIEPISVPSLFRYNRLALRVVAVLVFLGGLIGLGFAFSETAHLWFSRNILLSEKQWPRLSRIHVEGFDANGVAKIARGDSFLLTILAETATPQVPGSVTFQLRTLTGENARSFTINQFGTRKIDDVEYRSFFHTIPELFDPVSLSITAGDSRIDGLTIETVPPPMVPRTELLLRFPPYMQRTDQTIQATDRAFIPEGTTVTVRNGTNKPIDSAAISVNGQPPLAATIAEDGSLSLELPDLRTATHLEWTLTDFDGIKNRKPIRLELEIVKDQPPLVSSRLDGIGQAITPIAVLPTLGEVTDDYGLSEIRYRYSVARLQRPHAADDEPSEIAGPESEGIRQIASLGGTITNQPLGEAFSVAELLVQPGDRLSLLVEATDAFSLPPLKGEPQTQPHCGVGERFELEIVSAPRLKGILDAREIGLRQRFEALIEEVKRTRGLLEEIRLEKTSEQIAEEVKAKKEAENKNEIPTPKPDRIAEEQATQAVYNTQRSLRDSEKEKYDLGGIIKGFQGIRKEMQNNQIFTPEAQQRLDTGLLDPMRQLVERDFFEFDELLTKLGRDLENRETVERNEIQKSHQAALTQLDRILAKMANIRDRMVQMESFNEAIELLKEIIKEQESIRNETNEERKKQLRGLLE
ncbi:MAG: hypothetical protein FWC43_06260 [Planctomycetaceae bacterium]|nr:hypothetical protein [Planctomycetaceae bacterium]